MLVEVCRRVLVIVFVIKSSNTCAEFIVSISTMFACMETYKVVGRDVPPDLAAEIDALAEDERINDELERLKSEMGDKPVES